MNHQPAIRNKDKLVKSKLRSTRSKALRGSLSIEHIREEDYGKEMPEGWV